MPRITIGLSHKTRAGLQAHTNAYNADNGTALTVAQWATLRLQEIAIAPQLQAIVAALTEQHQRDANAALATAIRAARDELLFSLGPPP